MEIYEPREDSYLLSQELEKFLKTKKNRLIKIIDIGSGSGIQAETCKNLGFLNILVSDINETAVDLLKEKGFNVIKSNLFSNINKKEKFDLIIFNPPYLPLDKLEPKDSRPSTTGGKEGYELILKFLEQARTHLKENGVILLLFSSLSKPTIIIKKASKLGYETKKLSTKKLFFEELYVYKLGIK
jgi:release factor glutamine methyltransferase